MLLEMEHLRNERDFTLFHLWNHQPLSPRGSPVPASVQPSEPLTFMGCVCPLLSSTGKRRSKPCFSSRKRRWTVRSTRRRRAPCRARWPSCRRSGTRYQARRGVAWAAPGARGQAAPVQRSPTGCSQGLAGHLTPLALARWQLAPDLGSLSLVHVASQLPPLSSADTLTLQTTGHV